MNIGKWMIAALFFIVAFSAAIPAAAGDYQIGPGDVLNIEVWKDATLTQPAIVLPDGKITYPLIGEVQAAGRTVRELKEEIERRLARYVKDAVVTVEVRQVTSLQVYVLGKVKSPGKLPLTSNIDVLQALASAGGFDPFANRSRIRIFRRLGENIAIIPFDYDEVAAGRNTESNILLQRGDVIIVP